MIEPNIYPQKYDNANFETNEATTKRFKTMLYFHIADENEKLKYFFVTKETWMRYNIYPIKMEIPNPVRPKNLYPRIFKIKLFVIAITSFQKYTLAFAFATIL